MVYSAIAGVARQEEISLYIVDLESRTKPSLTSVREFFLIFFVKPIDF